MKIEQFCTRVCIYFKAIQRSLANNVEYWSKTVNYILISVRKPLKINHIFTMV